MSGGNNLTDGGWAERGQGSCRCCHASHHPRPGWPLLSLGPDIPNLEFSAGPHCPSVELRPLLSVTWPSSLSVHIRHRSRCFLAFLCSKRAGVMNEYPL